MARIDDGRWAREDMFFDCRRELAMSRWDHKNRKGMVRWFGDTDEQRASNWLFNDILFYGKEVSHAQYFSAARAFAARAHKGQRYGTRPYLFHLDCVASLVRRDRLPSNIEEAAYLHDVLEDCPAITEEELTSHFGEAVSRIVVALTKETDESGEEYFGRIRTAGYEAMYVKLADRLCNWHGCPNVPMPPRVRAKYEMQTPLLRATLYVGDLEDNPWIQLEALAQKLR